MNSRILAAALTQDTFSAGDLAARTGLKLNTVRSALKRGQTTFVPVPRDGEAHTRRGRPATRYRLADRHAASEQLQRSQDTAALTLIQRRPTVPDEELSPAEDQLLTLRISERFLLRALRNPDAEERVALAASATIAAEQALQAAQDEEQTQRAQSVTALAAIVRTAAEEPLDVTASALGHVVTRIIASLGYRPRVFSDGLLLITLLNIAHHSHNAPPIAVLTSRQETPAQALHGAHNMLYRQREVPNLHGILWSPTWAEPLLEHGLMAGIVVHSGAEQPDDQLQENIEHISDAWHVPLMLSHQPPQHYDAMFEKGATVLPTADLSLAVAWVNRTMQQHDRSAALTEDRDTARTS